MAGDKRKEKSIIGRKSSKRLFADLRRFADNGSLEASTFLHMCYRDGVLESVNGDELYKYSCLRCLQGDYEECWRMYLEGREVSKGFISDFVKREGFPLDRATRISDTEYALHDFWGEGGFSTVYFWADDPLDILFDLDRERTVGRLLELASDGDSRAAYDLTFMTEDAPEWVRELATRDDAYKTQAADRFLNCSYCSLFYSRLGEDGLAVLDEARKVEPEAGFVLAAYLYMGIDTPVDETRALECALDASEAGYDDASLLVSLMVDAPVATDAIRKQVTEVNARNRIEWSKTAMNEYGQMCVAQRPYTTPAIMSLQAGIEWRLIANMTRSDYEGFTKEEALRNDSGGYEDDVISIRPFNWYGEKDPVNASRPNFLFKPSGFNMEWYKYPWRSAEMSENLSLGEIRHIWRLCVDHLRTGRAFEPGTTRELLEVRPHRVEVPPELEGRVDTACARASEVDAFWVGEQSRICSYTYRPDRDDPPSEEVVRATIDVLRRRLGLAQP